MVLHFVKEVPFLALAGAVGILYLLWSFLRYPGEVLPENRCAGS